MAARAPHGPPYKKTAQLEKKTAQLEKKTTLLEKKTAQLEKKTAQLEKKTTLSVRTQNNYLTSYQ
jgi:hypothetical protein